MIAPLRNSTTITRYVPLPLPAPTSSPTTRSSSSTPMRKITINVMQVRKTKDLCLVEMRSTHLLINGQIKDFYYYNGKMIQQSLWTTTLQGMYLILERRHIYKNNSKGCLYMPWIAVIHQEPCVSKALVMVIQ